MSIRYPPKSPITRASQEFRIADFELRILSHLREHLFTVAAEVRNVKAAAALVVTIAKAAKNNKGEFDSGQTTQARKRIRNFEIRNPQSEIPAFLTAALTSAAGFFVI